MKTMMKLMALVMAMLLVVGCFAACTQDNGNGTTTEPSATAPTDPTTPSEPEDPTTPPDDGKTEYKVYVKNEDGTAVAGVWVQICKEGSTCFAPTATDESGCAVWRLDEAGDYYGTVSALGDNLPKEYFNDGFEITLIYNPSEA